MGEEEIFELRDTAYLAKYLGVCKKTMQRYMREGIVKSTRVGNGYRSTIWALRQAFDGLDDISGSSH